MKTFKEIRARDYKDEYKKFQSSPERIKYRSELVKFNREKGLSELKSMGKQIKYYPAISDSY